MCIKIGITGGIGSGKTVVAHLLAVMGIPVYDADTESKKLTGSDRIIRKKLISLLGEDVYKDGTLNKPFLTSYLFGKPEHAAKVNAIIHPRVKEHFLDWAEKHRGFDIIAIESAILVESGFAGYVDKVVWVSAPAELRLERAVKRDGTSKELIMKRVACQMSDEEHRLHADFVIRNDDYTPLIPQILRLIELLQAEILS